MSKQTQNKRSNHKDNGDFAKGNKLGNRWKKGESGNPNGRKNAYTDLIRDFSFQKVNDKERREIILQKLFQLAERGDLRAIQFIVERLEGRAIERQERTTKSEPIQVMVIND
jgi:hypothetical protein|tara:strand:- start:824 stop:1159 length:336 start_codon:yes stop_codon:yes gene_type:complete